MPQPPAESPEKKYARLEQNYIRYHTSHMPQRSLRILIELENIRAERRRGLLVEFLGRKYVGQQVNAWGETYFGIEIQNQVTFEYDLLFLIFSLLPAESLFRLQFICKKWFSLINSSIFIKSHAQQSKTVLICQKLTLLEPGSDDASLPSLWPQGMEHKPKSYFHFFNLDQGDDDDFIESTVVELVDIQASYDGLVVATMKMNKRLILMNPVTRKHTELPAGAEGICGEESFGIVFCNKAKTYKVVHLFHGTSRFVACEILNICTRKWTLMEGPPELFSSIRQIPVSVGGSLYWMPVASE